VAGNICRPEPTFTIDFAPVNEGSTLTAAVFSVRLQHLRAATIQSFATTLLLLTVKVLDSDRGTCFHGLVWEGADGQQRLC
jgi:hypothetical protein